MATPSWHNSGQYYENCSCHFASPCVAGAAHGQAHPGAVDHRHGIPGSGREATAPSPPRSGVYCASLGRRRRRARAPVGWSDCTPGPVPSIAMPSPRSRADPPAVPWPPCHPRPEFLGVESAPTRFDRSGAEVLAARGLRRHRGQPARPIHPSATEPIHPDKTGHPAAVRFALAHAVKSQVTALGLSRNDMSGKNHGQYAPFSWRGAQPSIGRSPHPATVAGPRVTSLTPSWSTAARSCSSRHMPPTDPDVRAGR